MANSDELIIDLTSYKDRVGSRVTPGRYRVQVEDVETDKSANGNPMVNLWLRVVGGDHDGATIVDRLVLTERSLFRVVGFMQAIGLPTPKKRLKLNVRQFMGKVLDVDVEDGDPYNGRVKSEVRGYLQVPKSERSSSSSDADSDADELDGLSEFTSQDTEEQAPSAEKPQAAEQSSNDDEEEIDLDEVNL